MRVRPETPADHDAVRAVNDAAFGGTAEGILIDALRGGGHARASLVADDAGGVVGHVLFSALAIETAAGTVPALALAPLAVRPERQRAGVGTALVRAGLDLCRARGERIVVVVGDPRYYARFGFSAALAEPLASPYAGPHCMALELVPGALSGVRGRVVYAPPFQAL